MGNIKDKLSLAADLIGEGLVAGDQILSSTDGESGNSHIVIEKQQEAHNVFKDLLEGVLSDEVKEMRHEMYFTEMRSRDYDYGGGGQSKKKSKNSFFSYKGKADVSDGNEVTMIIPVSGAYKTMSDEGIKVCDDGVYVDEKLVNGFRMTEDYSTQYNITIKRDFTPRFPLEKYTKQLVVKNIDENKAVLDLYIPCYADEYSSVHRMFQAEMKRICEGDYRNDTVKIKGVSFTTKHNCYGSRAHMYYEYDNADLKEVFKYEGNYIIRYVCDITCNGKDMLTEKEIYNETTEQKCRNRERRENAVIDFNAVQYQMDKETADLSEEENLLEEIRQNKQ